MMDPRLRGDDIRDRLLTPRGNPAPQSRILKKKQAQRDREKIKVGIVAGQKNQSLKPCKSPKGRQPRSTRSKNKPGDDTLNHEHQHAGDPVKQNGPLMNVPGHGIRKRLSLVMDGERRKMAPKGVPAQPFDEGGLKHE